MKRAKKWFWKLLQFHGGADALECAMVVLVILLGTAAAQSTVISSISAEFAAIGNSL
jgi:Flp pilus assembly pilin Flp